MCWGRKMTRTFRIVAPEAWNVALLLYSVTVHRFMTVAFHKLTVVPAFGLDALLPLLLHLLRRGVVDVGFALGEQLLGQSHDDGKMVTGVGKLVRLDLEHGNIFQDYLGWNNHVSSFSVFLFCFLSI